MICVIGINLATPVLWTAVAMGLVIGSFLTAVIDLKTKRLPREVSYIVMALGAPLLVIAALIEGESRRIYMALLGSVIALAVMGVLYAMSRGGLGEGDVRLSPLLGMYLGWLNPGLALVGLFYGFILGSVIGIMMMIMGRADRQTQLPFGPFLAAGSVMAIFYGQNLINVVLGH